VTAFWLLAPIMVAAALGMLLVKKAVHSALLLALVMICLAVLYAVQSAPFLFAVQIIVYTGAILMLFLFVLMLVGVDSSDSLIETLRFHRVATVVVALAFAALLGGAIVGAVVQEDGSVAAVGLAEANAEGNVVGIARLLFTDYLFAFELTSALLITATLGGMVLAHKERTEPKASQRELARRRFAGDKPWSLPGPGVFAGTNSTATPALLPDGTEAPDSVSAVLERSSAERAGEQDPLARGLTRGGES